MLGLIAKSVHGPGLVPLFLAIPMILGNLKMNTSPHFKLYLRELRPLCYG